MRTPARLGVARFFLTAAIAAASLWPARASAQTYFVGYFGSNHTQPADITIRQPSLDTELTFGKVPFDSRPFGAPIYYGYRLGHLFKGHRIGLELEFLHQKVIGRTSAVVHVTGRDAGTPIDDDVSMSAFVERYQMTHGLNFILCNVVFRQPIGGEDSPLALMLRGGAGPTLPHAESTIDGVSREQYEFAGIGASATAGVTLRVASRLSALAEYKLTYAAPTMSIADGEGKTIALGHQITFGFAITLKR